MRPKLRRRFDLHFTASASPSEPPIINVILLDVMEISEIFSASSSEDNSLPSMHSVTTKEFWGSFARIFAPSFSLINSISFPEALSGIFSSCTSVMLSFTKRESRFAYSSIAAVKYFSFIFPTDIILIFLFLVLKIMLVYTCPPPVASCHFPPLHLIG